MFSSLTLVSVLLLFRIHLHPAAIRSRRTGARLLALPKQQSRASRPMKNLAEIRWRHLPGLRRARFDEAFGHSKSVTFVSMVMRVAAIVPTTWAT